MPTTMQPQQAGEPQEPQAALAGSRGHEPTRRGVMVAALAAAGAAAACTTTPAGAVRAPFVLVHGAWHGAWCWRDVRRLLAAQGHEVFTPTLTGMGERHHLSSAAVDLDTHRADIAAAIEAEELQGVVLVAHSYAGYPAIAALPRIAARVSHLVLLDSLLPEPGRASADGWPPAAREQVMKTLGEGFRLASFPAAAFGVPPDHPEHAWVSRRLTDMPIGPLMQRFPAEPSLERLPVRTTYIRCTRNTLPDARRAAERAAALRLPVLDLDAAHDAMVTAPAALTQQLLALGKR
jgi:pimeloyl-ACP methyl ester carboxylesterase